MVLYGMVRLLVGLLVEVGGDSDRLIALPNSGRAAP